jgi:hypothetical protein
MRERNDMSTAKNIFVIVLSGLSAGILSNGSSAESLKTPISLQADALWEFSAQTRQQRVRPRIRIQREQPAAWPYPRPDEYSWPGPGAVRQCVDWYSTEYRPSGTVVTPQMRCRWVRG